MALIKQQTNQHPPSSLHRQLQLILGLVLVSFLICNFYLLRANLFFDESGKSVKELILAEFTPQFKDREKFTPRGGETPKRKPLEKINDDPLVNHYTKKHQNPKETQARDTAVGIIPNESQNASTFNSDVSNSGYNYTCQYGRNDTLEMPRNTPTFVLIGVQKSGTTSLLTYFRDHPQILQTTKKARREAHFFDGSVGPLKKKARKLKLTASQKWCFYLSHYAKLFDLDALFRQQDTSKPYYTFEKTPSYFASKDVPYRLKKTCPWCKVVLILRNPIDRAYSQYKMTIRDAHKTRGYSMEDFINHEITRMQEWNMTSFPALNQTSGIKRFHHIPIPVESWTRKLEDEDGHLLDSHKLLRKGLYSVQLKWWLEHFTPFKDMIVLDYQDLLDDTQSVYRRILEFSNIPLVQVDDSQFGRARQSYSTTPMANTTREYLHAFFRPYNAELERLLGPEWRLDKLKGW